MAKCKFCDDVHHAKCQRVFCLLKATPFPAQSKNRLPRQHHHRAVCPPIGNEWLTYLRQAGISYCIRCKVRR